MSQKLATSPAVVGIDIGKNSFHIVGQNQRGAIVLRQKWSRGQVETRLANLPPCLIGKMGCPRHVRFTHVSCLTADIAGGYVQTCLAGSCRRHQMNQQGQWQVAGSAPEVYERELVPAVFGVWAPILVELAQPRSGERVVDVACGTGIVARFAAKRVGPTGAVVGVDLNPGMCR
jgi:2-polyprenyl-3-methyl-5-hydroxy-6-metoxy-1,4-benzoquinol methylase